jgi:hypothetical protein
MRNPRLKPLHKRWTPARMEARCARMVRRAENPPTKREPIKFERVASPAFDLGIVAAMANIAARLGVRSGARKARSMGGR